MKLLTSLALAALALTPEISNAELYVVTSNKSSIQALTRNELEAAFLGYSLRYSGGTIAGLVDLPSGSVRADFYNKLTGKTPSQVNAYWSRLVFTGKAIPPQEAKSNVEARDLIAAGTNIVGYVSKSDLNSNLRVLLVLP